VFKKKRAVNSPRQVVDEDEDSQAATPGVTNTNNEGYEEQKTGGGTEMIEFGNNDAMNHDNVKPATNSLVNDEVSTSNDNIMMDIIYNSDSEDDAQSTTKQMEMATIQRVVSQSETTM